MNWLEVDMSVLGSHSLLQFEITFHHVPGVFISHETTRGSALSQPFPLPARRGGVAG